jgi:hypothetical protein
MIFLVQMFLFSIVLKLVYRIFIMSNKLCVETLDNLKAILNRPDCRPIFSGLLVFILHIYASPVKPIMKILIK